MKLTLAGLGLVVAAMAALKYIDASPMQAAGGVIGALVIFVVIPDIVRAVIADRRRRQAQPYAATVNTEAELLAVFRRAQAQLTAENARLTNENADLRNRCAAATAELRKQHDAVSTPSDTDDIVGLLVDKMMLAVEAEYHALIAKMGGKNTRSVQLHDATALWPQQWRAAAHAVADELQLARALIQGLAAARDESTPST